MANRNDVGSGKLDARHTYQHPDQVLLDEALTREQKIEILREWYYDAVRLQESESENMSGGETDMLQAVSKALLKLDVSPAAEQDPNGPKPWWKSAWRYVEKVFARPG